MRSVLCRAVLSLAWITAACQTPRVASTVAVTAPAPAMPAEAPRTAPEVVPDARSAVLRATHCFEVEVTAVAHDPDHAEGHELTLRVVRVFKGSPGEGVGATFEVPVQTAVPGGAIEGPWSGIGARVGARAYVFVSASSTTVRGLFAEPSFLEVMPAALASHDVTLAFASEARPFDEALAEARLHAARLGPLFADYLWARHGARALVDAHVRDALFALLLEPAVAADARARMALLADNLADEPDATAEYLDAYTVTLFELLALPEASALHDEIVARRLPTLARAPRTPAEAFRTRPAAWVRARHTLARWRGRGDVTALRAWIRASD